MTGDQHVDQFVDDFVHGLLSPDDEQQFRRHCERCSACRTACEEAVRRRDIMRALPAAKASQDLIQGTLRQARAAAAARPSSRPAKRGWMHGRVAASFWATVAASALIVTSLHVYYATLTPDSFDLLVYGQRTLDVGVQESLRVVVRHALNGRAVAGVPVSIELRGRHADYQTQLAMYTTDEHGSASPQLMIPDWPDGDYELVVRAKRSGRNDIIRRNVRLRRAGKLMLSSDKPVYQPGQVVHLRCLFLSLPHRKPVSAQEAVFRVRDPKGNLIFKSLVPTSRFGIASAECPLATELIEGAYQISCAVGTTESELTVKVERYVLPKFRIDATLDRSYYQPGDTARLALKSEYFFGKPLSGASLEATVVVRGSPRTELQQLSARLNHDGEAQLSYRVPDVLAGDPLNFGDAELTFELRVTDTAGQEHARSVSAIATSRPLRVDVVHESGDLVPGVSNRFFFFVTYADGKPAHADIRVSGVGQKLTTNDQGIAVAEFTPAQGTIELDVRAVDQNGLVAHRELTLRSQKSSAGFVLRTDQSVYDGGDTVRLLVLGHGVEPVFVDLLKDGQTLLTTSVDVNEGRGDLQFDLPAELSGTIQICGYRFGEHGLAGRRTQTILVRPPNQVHVATHLDREEYRPGERATLSLQLTDDDHQPVAGAISLALVDEAVFSVRSQRPGMEQLFFALDQQLLAPTYAFYRELWLNQARDSNNQQLVARATFARAGADETRPGIRDESRPPSSRQNPHSLAARSYPEKLAATRVTKRHGLRTVNRVWISLAVISALGALSMIVRTALQAGLVVGGTLSLGLLLMPAMNAAREAAVGTTSLADASAANAEAMGSEQPSSSERVRSWFPETLLWRPEIITDDKGMATLDVDLADSITDWRLAASAVTAEGMLGAAEGSIRVFQPFFVDVNLPVALIRNDEVAVPVIVYNYQDRASRVELAVDEADWFELLEDGHHTLDLQPRQVASTHFRIRVVKVGRHELTLRAAGQSGVRDAIQRTVQVDPNGQLVEQVNSGSLNAPVAVELALAEHVVPGSARAIVKVYPSAFSQLVEGLDGILQRPRGCFEQTSSSTYPNVLALDYLRRTDQSLPEIEAKARQFIHLGYQRLLTFEVGGGGFDWFGSPPAHELLTAYGLMEFNDMARVHDVDPALLERTRKWLLKRRRLDGSWEFNDRVMHDDPTIRASESLRRLTSTAYIAWAVYQGHADAGAEATLEFIVRHRPDQIDSAYVLALVCNAIYAIDPHCPAAKPYVDRLVSMRESRPDEQLSWWTQNPNERSVFYGSGESGTIEATALAVLALLAAEEQPQVVRQALGWLVTQKDPSGTWHSTQATVLALKALLAGTGTALDGGRERRFEVALDGAVVHEFIVPPQRSDVVQQLVLTDQQIADTNRLEVRETTESASACQIIFRQHVEGTEPFETPGPFGISVSYDSNQLRVQETVLARAVVENRTDQNAPMLMVDLPIPPGFGVERESLEGFRQHPVVAKYEITPRSIILYLRNLAPRERLELPYRLRALMPVRVTTPAARTYLYYDPEQEASAPPQTIVVTL